MHILDYPANHNGAKQLYSLQRHRGDEYTVQNLSGASVGTIRALTSRTWGWIDRTGRHEFGSQHDAVIACLGGATTRIRRQRYQYEIAIKEGAA